jgi:hypothetical protein
MAFRCQCLDIIVMRNGIALNKIHLQKAWECFRVQIHSELAGGRASRVMVCWLTTAYKWFGGNRNPSEYSGFLRNPE